MTAQIEAFDRQQISSLLGIPYALVKNWSTGRPLSIQPSIHAPSQRGKQSLYSREDVYRFALAQFWAGRGMNFSAIASLLSHLKSEWFTTKARGTLLVVQLTDKTRLLHFPRNAEVTALEHAEELLESRKQDGDMFHVLRLGKILDSVDEKISGLKGAQGQ
jgi:hypothetical protein